MLKMQDPTIRGPQSVHCAEPSLGSPFGPIRALSRQQGHAATHQHVSQLHQQLRTQHPIDWEVLRPFSPHVDQLRQQLETVHTLAETGGELPDLHPLRSGLRQLLDATTLDTDKTLRATPGLNRLSGKPYAEAALHYLHGAEKLAFARTLSAPTAHLGESLEQFALAAHKISDARGDWLTNQGPENPYEATVQQIRSALASPATQPQQFRRPVRYARGDSEEQSFWNGLAENSRDQAPHLIYADWLQEQGHDAEAEAQRRYAQEFLPQPQPVLKTIADHFHDSGNETADRMGLLGTIIAYGRAHPQLQRLTPLLERLRHPTDGVGMGEVRGSFHFFDNFGTSRLMPCVSVSVSHDHTQPRRQPLVSLLVDNGTAGSYAVGHYQVDHDTGRQLALHLRDLHRSEQKRATERGDGSRETNHRHGAHAADEVAELIRQHQAGTPQPERFAAWPDNLTQRVQSPEQTGVKPLFPLGMIPYAHSQTPTGLEPKAKSARARLLDALRQGQVPTATTTEGPVDGTAEPLAFHPHTGEQLPVAQELPPLPVAQFAPLPEIRLPEARVAYHPVTKEQLPVAQFAPPEAPAPTPKGPPPLPRKTKLMLVREQLKSAIRCAAGIDPEPYTTAWREQQSTLLTSFGQHGLAQLIRTTPTYRVEAHGDGSGQSQTREAHQVSNRQFLRTGLNLKYLGKPPYADHEMFLLHLSNQHRAREGDPIWHQHYLVNREQARQIWEEFEPVSVPEPRREQTMGMFAQHERMNLLANLGVYLRRFPDAYHGGGGMLEQLRPHDYAPLHRSDSNQYNPNLNQEEVKTKPNHKLAAQEAPAPLRPVAYEVHSSTGGNPYQPKSSHPNLGAALAAMPKGNHHILATYADGSKLPILPTEPAGHTLFPADRADEARGDGMGYGWHDHYYADHVDNPPLALQAWQEWRAHPRTEQHRFGPGHHLADLTTLLGLYQHLTPSWSKAMQHPDALAMRQQAVEQHDFAPLAVLADWLDEQGDDAAQAHARVIRNRLRRAQKLSAREQVRQAIRLEQDMKAPAETGDHTESKPEGCTCNYPIQKLRNGSGHGRDKDGKPCPKHKEYLSKNVWGKKKGETKERRSISWLHQEWNLNDGHDEGAGGGEAMQRRPVKNAATPEDIAGLHRAIAANPEDDAHWLIAADAFEEQGHSAMAGLLREVTKHPTHPNREGPYRDPLDFRDWPLPPAIKAQAVTYNHTRSIGGAIMGVPLIVRHFTVADAQGANIGSFFHANVFRPEIAGVYHGSCLADSIPLTAEHGHQLLDELTPEHKWDQSNKDEIQAVRPAQLHRSGRAVRCAEPAAMAALFQGIKENPSDRARPLIAADGLEEAGYDHTAALLRKIARSPADGRHTDAWNAPMYNPNGDLAKNTTLNNTATHQYHPQVVEGKVNGVHVVVRPYSRRESQYSHTHAIVHLGGILAAATPLSDLRGVLDEMQPYEGNEEWHQELKYHAHALAHVPAEQLSHRGHPVRFTELASRDTVADDHWKQLADYLEQHGLRAAATVVRSGQRITPEEYERWRSRQFLSGAEVIQAALGGHAKVQGRYYSQGNLQGEFLHFPTQGHGLLRLGAWLQSIGQPSPHTPPDEDFPWAATMTSHEYAEPQSPVAFHVTEPQLANAAAQELKTTADLHRQQLAAHDGPEALPWSPPQKARLRRPEKLTRGGADEQGFIHSLRQRPHDQAPRLIYSDWLEEHGADEEAALHRHMAQLYGQGSSPVRREIEGGLQNPHHGIQPSPAVAQLIHEGGHSAYAAAYLNNPVIPFVGHLGNLRRARGGLMPDHHGTLEAGGFIHSGPHWNSDTIYGGLAMAPGDDRVTLLTHLSHPARQDQQFEAPPPVVQSVDYNTALEISQRLLEQAQAHRRPATQTHRIEQLNALRALIQQHQAQAAQPQQMSLRTRFRQAIQMAAQKDRPVSIQGAQGRIDSGNHYTLLNTLRDILNRSGLSPNKVYPAIHDVGGNARAAALAEILGMKNDQSGAYGAAWQGLIAHLPELVLFRSHPQGKDSVYRMGFKGPQQAMSQLLDKIGVQSRVFVPHKEGSQVYVYDRGRGLRQPLGDLASSMELEVVEHTGDGEFHGGGDDMGRASYRDTINTNEAPALRQQRGTPVRCAATEQDFHQLWDQIAAYPQDNARWLIAADALEELGKPQLAQFFRFVTQLRHSTNTMAAERPVAAGDNGFRRGDPSPVPPLPSHIWNRQFDAWEDHVPTAQLGNMHLRAIRWGIPNPEDFDIAEKPENLHFWSIDLSHHTPERPQGHLVVDRAYLPHEQGLQLLRELPLAEPRTDYEREMQPRLHALLHGTPKVTAIPRPLPGEGSHVMPQQFARRNPVRLMHDLPAFGNQVQATPEDYAPKFAALDYLRDHGHDLLAEAAERGIKLHYGTEYRYQTGHGLLPGFAAFTTRIGDPTLGVKRPTLRIVRWHDPQQPHRFWHQVRIKLPAAQGSVPLTDFFTIDHDLAHRLLTEIPHGEVGYGSTFARGAMRQFLEQRGHGQKPQQLQRPRRPVRCEIDDPHWHQPWGDAIHENPEDRAHHLIYADALEEQGDPRHQIVRDTVAHNDSGIGYGWGQAIGQHGGPPTYPDGSYLFLNHGYVLHPGEHYGVLQGRTPTHVIVSWLHPDGSPHFMSYVPRHQIHDYLADFHPAVRDKLYAQLAQEQIKPRPPREMREMQEFSRARQPVKCGPEDIAPLHAAVAEKNQDDARWLILADALEENNSPATAAWFRQIAQSPHLFKWLSHGKVRRSSRMEAIGVNYDDRLHNSAWNFGPAHEGTVHGIPLQLQHITRQGPDRQPLFAPYYEAHVLEPAPSGDSLVHKFPLPLEHAQQIMQEFDPPDRELRLKDQAIRHPGEGTHLPPQQFQRRPVLATRGGPEEKSFLGKIEEHPLDPAPRQIYADWIHDHGDEHEAEANLHREIAGLYAKGTSPIKEGLNTYRTLARQRNGYNVSFSHKPEIAQLIREGAGPSAAHVFEHLLPASFIGHDVPFRADSRNAARVVHREAEPQHPSYGAISLGIRHNPGSPNAALFTSLETTHAGQTSSGGVHHLLEAREAHRIAQEQIDQIEASTPADLHPQNRYLQDWHNMRYQLEQAMAHHGQQPLSEPINSKKVDPDQWLNDLQQALARRENAARPEQFAKTPPEQGSDYYGSAPTEEWLKPKHYRGRPAPEQEEEGLGDGWVPVRSTWIAGLRRTVRSRIVEMLTKKGKKYGYELPKGALPAWLNATSKGKWWWAHVHGGSDAGTRLSRAGLPVRCAAPEEHQQMQHALHVAYQQKDHAPPLIYADMLEEEGHHELAQGLRQAHGMKTLAPAPTKVPAGQNQFLPLHLFHPVAGGGLYVTVRARGTGGAIDHNGYYPRASEEAEAHTITPTGAEVELATAHPTDPNYYGSVHWYQTADLDHLRGLMEKLEDIHGDGYSTAHHNSVRTALGLPPRPHALQRARRAVQLANPQIVSQLHAGLSEDIHDQGRWNVLADAVRENGYDGWAYLLQMLGMGENHQGNGQRTKELWHPAVQADHHDQRNHVELQLGTLRTWLAPLYHRRTGELAGAYFQVPSDPETGHPQGNVGGYALLPTSDLRVIMHEAHPELLRPTASPTANQEHRERFDNLMRDLYPERQEPVAKLQRAVQFMQDTHAFGRKIREGDFRDRAPKLVYADYVEEQGYPHLAAVLRRANGQETPNEVDLSQIHPAYRDGEFMAPTGHGLLETTHGFVGPTEEHKPRPYYDASGLPLVSVFAYHQNEKQLPVRRYHIVVSLPTKAAKEAKETAKDGVGWSSVNGARLMTHDHALVRGLLQEMQPEEQPAREQMRAYLRRKIGGAIRRSQKKLQRPTKPVRCAHPEEIQQLHNALAENPHDEARWGILADAVEEHGHSGIAHLLRTLGGGENVQNAQPNQAIHKVVRSPGIDSTYQFHHGHPITFQYGGLGVTATPLSHRASPTGQTGLAGVAFEVPHWHNGWFRGGTAYLNPEAARHILSDTHAEHLLSWNEEHHQTQQEHFASLQHELGLTPT